MRALSIVMFSFLAFSSAAAHAEESPERTYASAEARAAAGRIGIGALSIGGGAVALSRGTAFGTSFGVPTLAGGALQISLGTYDFVVRTRQPLRLVQGIEASLLVGGGLTAYFGSGSDGARGFGLGLALQSGLALLADVLAERRADRYAEALRRVRVGVTTTPSGGAMWIGAAM